MLDQVIIRKPVLSQTSHLSKNQHSLIYTSQKPGHHSWQLPLPHSPLSFIPTENMLLYFPSLLPSLEAKPWVSFSRARNSVVGVQESILTIFQSLLCMVARIIFWKHKFMSFHCLKLGFFFFFVHFEYKPNSSKLVRCLPIRQLQFTPLSLAHQAPRTWAFFHHFVP